MPRPPATTSSIPRPAGSTPSSHMPPNGSRTTTQATLSELADILAGCTGGTVATCARLLAAASAAERWGAADDAAGGARHRAEPGPQRIPHLRLAQDRRLHPAPQGCADGLGGLAHLYRRWLQRAGPGTAFDSRGNVWSTNNFAPPIGTAAGLGLISLEPDGHADQRQPGRRRRTGGRLVGHRHRSAQPDLDQQLRRWRHDPVHTAGVHRG